MSRDELAALQWARFQKILRCVWEKQAFYRKKMDAAGIHPEDIRSMEDVANLPFTTKDDLRGCFPYNGFVVPMEDVVRIHASSGTTGQATVVGYTQGDLQTWAELMARLQTAGGMTKKDIVQIAFGYGFFTGALGHHYGAELLGATVLPVSAGKSERQIQIMRDYQTTALICTPSYGAYLAEVRNKMGISEEALRLRIAFFGGEGWTDAMRENLQNSWGAFATDNYGLSEVMGPGVSYECVEQRGMHIAEDHFYVELIQSATGVPSTDVFGVGGEVVITTLTKEGIPVIRYRTRDLCHFLPGDCACGRTMLRMSKMMGRSDDMLIIRGVNVFPQQIEEVLMSVHGIQPHYQIVVDSKEGMDALEVHVEVEEGMLFDQMSHQQEFLRMVETRIENSIMVKAKVRLVEPNSLTRFEGKATRVVDRRKAGTA